MKKLIAFLIIVMVAISCSVFKRSTKSDKVYLDSLHEKSEDTFAVRNAFTLDDLYKARDEQLKKEAAARSIKRAPVPKRTSIKKSTKQEITEEQEQPVSTPRKIILRVVDESGNEVLTRELPNIVSITSSSMDI